MSAPRLANIPDAAAYWHVSEATLWRWLKDGLLTRYRIGPKFVRVDLNELDAMVRAEAGAR